MTQVKKLAVGKSCLVVKAMQVVKLLSSLRADCPSYRRSPAAFGCPSKYLECIGLLRWPSEQEIGLFLQEKISNSHYILSNVQACPLANLLGYAIGDV